ncbi:hypothetical protein PVAG01_00646 [Phlyctema vagabunda]|uniref:Uncharacterized protein n=1 Tax=Phlyctema vagabunda TaxID=108571 RepID=A0ABR4PUU2_9HELO
MSSTTNPTHGTKVTTDPERFTNPSTESAGPVASDSLAAESDRAGGEFSENRNSEPLGVSGSNSTFANTNTSGAHKLSAATDAESRSDGNDSATYPSGLGGQSKGTTVTDTTRGSDPNLGGEGRGNLGGSHVDEAPSYVNSQYIDAGKPKGKNLTEGGFSDDDGKNASFNGDIGGKNDPGRLAEQGFDRSNAAVDNVAAVGTGKTDGGKYDTLGDADA